MHGRNGWHMEPTVATETKDKTRPPAVSDDSAGYGDLLFCSLPYFCLDQHCLTNMPRGARLHPSQPLLQSYHPSIGKQRDMQQAINHLQGIPDDHCFHISALWCLIIADQHIVTCVKGLSAETILTESIKVQHILALSPVVTGTSTLPTVLQVLHENRLWLIPIDQCDTWFKFMQRLSDVTFSFEELFYIRWRGRVLEPSQWRKFIAHAKSSSSRIHIIRRKHAKQADGIDVDIPSNHTPDNLSSPGGLEDDSMSTIKKSERGSRSPSHTFDVLEASNGPDRTPLTASLPGPKASSEDSKDLKERLSSLLEPFPPTQKLLILPSTPKSSTLFCGRQSALERQLRKPRVMRTKVCH